MWAVETSETPSGPAIRLTYVSKDGEEGYPGTVNAAVVYTLTDENEFRVDMDRDDRWATLVNLAQHTYWNLGGIASGTILDAELTLYADKFTPGDPMVPIRRDRAGSRDAVRFHFAQAHWSRSREGGRQPCRLRRQLDRNGDAHAMRPVAKVKDPKSGRVMTLTADQPGVQFYSGNFLDGSLKGKGVVYQKHAALCLETQVFPNAINVPAWQKDVILRPGQTYRHTMVHKLTAE